MDKVNYSFPSLIVPEKDKNEDWHKAYVQAIVNRSIAEGYSDRYAIANECVNFYFGIQSGDEFNFLQRAEDGDILPAKWASYSRIGNKIDIMTGELSQRKYEIYAKGLNKELTSRKLQEREKRRIDLRFQSIAEELQQENGMPLQGPPQPIQGGFTPESEEDLDDFFDKSYKDISEIVVESSLKYVAKLNNWDYQRIAIFRDILIQGMGFCRTELCDGIPISERVDPRNMIWDVNAKDDFLSDATYFGEVNYMNIGDAIDKFKLTKKEIEDAYSSYQDSMLYAGQNYALSSDYGVLNRNNSLRFFRMEGGELRVLVTKAVWVDYKAFNSKVTTDNYGQEHIKIGVESEGKDTKRTQIKIWRQGTLIAGKFLKNWGEMKNQARDWGSLSYCEAPYKAIIPNYMNGVTMSKVRRMQAMQNIKDIALYRMQLDMARAGAKSFIYDINMLPAGYTIENVLKYARTAGIMLVDSASGQPSGFNQLRDIDQTISNNITSYLMISEMMDREMDSVTGINEARQGQVKNASQAVGVTQSSLFQSNLSTAVYFDLFSQFCSKVLNYQAKLIKIAWAGNQRFAPIIGDQGIDFLAMDVDMDLHDYAVFVEEVPPMIQDQQNYQQMIIAAVQANQLTFVQAMNLLLEKDVRVGVRRLERENRKFMKEQQAQQAAEQQAMMQQQQQELAAQAQMNQQNQQADFAKQAMDQQGQLKQIAAKGRVDLRSDLIDFKKVIAQAQMQKDLEKIKAARASSGS